MSTSYKGTTVDEKGNLKPTAATARELLRRQNGYDADKSFDETLKYFGYDDNTDPNSVLNTSADLPEDNPVTGGFTSTAVSDKSDVSDLKSQVIDKIASGENSYYNTADVMEKPEYESQYSDKINDLVDKILNGEKFEYDLNADAVYQQYKDEYARSAKRSADNAMNSAMSASGGYANSYAQAAAQQAYNAEMQNLGEMVPEFEAQAYDRYADEKQEQYNQLSVLQNSESTDYSKFRDEVSDFYADRDYQLGMGDRYNQDLYNQANLYQTVEDSDFNKEMTLEEFAFNKEQYANDKAYQDAAAAAELGDFSKMSEYLGIDTTEAKQWYDVTKAAEMYSATGMISFLKDAGLDTTELEADLSDEKFYNSLTTALAIYEATGDPSKLKELGIDTSYSDQLLNYSLVAAKNSANGSSGSGGSGSSNSSDNISNDSDDFSGNSTTDYWINQRLTEKQLNNYNSHNNTSKTLKEFVSYELKKAHQRGEISTEELEYLYDYFGV